MMTLMSGFVLHEPGGHILGRFALVAVGVAGDADVGGIGRARPASAVPATSASAAKLSRIDMFPPAMNGSAIRSVGTSLRYRRVHVETKIMTARVSPPMSGGHCGRHDAGMNGHDKPLIVFDPFPRPEAVILDDESRALLGPLARIEAHYGARAPDAFIEQLLPGMAILVGQAAMPAERLRIATNLRAIINVKGNWEPNIDYAEAHARGIHVLSVAPVFGDAVAEMLLGFALDLGREITAGDRLFREGRELYGQCGNLHATGLFDARVGLIGLGNLGRALLPLLRPFRCAISVHDPWLSNEELASHDVMPCGLETLLAGNQFLFILAGATTENAGFLDREKLSLIPSGAVVILGGRAEVVAFDDFVEMANAGRFRAAIDVFPEEPVAGNAPVRSAANVLLSAHRAGGIEATYARMRRAIAADIAAILEGNPPSRLQPADPRRASMMRSR